MRTTFNLTNKNRSRLSAPAPAWTLACASLALVALPVIVVVPGVGPSTGPSSGPGAPPPERGAISIAPADSTVRVERLGIVMGTELRVSVNGGGRDVALAAAEGALRELERMDALLTTWDSASPMGALNRAPIGEPIGVSPELSSLLAEARAWSVRTGGAFTPAIGALVDAWGLRRGGVRPDARALAAARVASGPETWVIGPAAGTVTRRNARAWIDTGGFGKGAALRTARDTLRALGVGSALLDLGGQLLAVGKDASTERPWNVAVAHPAGRRQPVAVLALEDVSVATSGNSERAGSADGEAIGHLIDPRTGHPVPAWGSVTVVAADPFVADVLSTALYVMGPPAGPDFVRDQDQDWAPALGDVGALFLIERGGALVSCWNAAMERWLGPPFMPADRAHGAEASRAAPAHAKPAHRNDKEEACAS